ncbi:ABC transporter ATP-binding protein [Desulfovibrio subterraneus]|jgi:glycerol transport system ATP-binding protein|uniref:ABC transporter n=1 Tax=Desulfovibrio subterraneus TaxID=2718620 RepID=A0A7J0BKS0_9BACT|nr:ABC transporter ATP-binding protein [Desulfovibrio subterraneus]WBF68319.1 ABC transporter ATP-binding protein [Desulfovibrio subterraneus]GFM34270.1 ABC transporter [Desulfovibrio subterraneus]
MGLQLKDVSKFVGQEVHLKDISLHLEPGSRYVVLGRTLAGKTSLLRVMAGLDRPSKGTVVAGGVDVTGVSVRKRNIGMVYQQFINYPSLTIYDNIASPLKIHGVPKAEVDRRVREAASMLHIDHLLDRLPAELSGGQQQRTAIARALVKDVDLLLLDEPLVNLDYKLREELRDELQKIFGQRDSVVVYTTTEPSEALMLGGNVIVMHEGRVLQVGTTTDVYQNPANVKVAQVFSDPPINFIPVSIEENCNRFGEDLCLPPTSEIAALPKGEYTFGIRSNKFSLFDLGEGYFPITGTVGLAEINGSETFIHFMHGNESYVVQEEGVHTRKVGSRIAVYAHPGDFYVFNKAGNLLVAPKHGR